MSQMEKEGEKRMLGASQGRSATARGGVAEFSSRKISVTWGGIFHLLLFFVWGEFGGEYRNTKLCILHPVII